MTLNINRTVTVLASLMFLPGRAVEEGLHVLAAFPFAKELSVHIDPERGTAHTSVEFRAGTPRWAVRLAYQLPEIAAAGAGLAVIAYWLVAGPIWLPATTVDWLLLSLFGAQWLAIALPSGLDMDQTAEGSK
jgi:hypothetical protein